MKILSDNKHYFYFLLMLFGGGLTFYYAILGTIAHDGNFNAAEFIMSTWTSDYYARSLTLDFWTGTIAGTFFLLVEGVRLKMKKIWIYLILTVMIGYAFGFPLFLFMRELKLKSLKN
jgi:hypothetical protein